MYSKLAFRNVKKSYKDFFIYFITLTFSVSLFYVFNSFDKQADIMKLSEGQGSMVMALVTVMSAMSVVVSFVFAFLILYANSFLIKRRKKELGLYTLLGMDKHKISLILIIETLLIGMVSLVTGLLLGYALSQGMSLVSAKLLAVPVEYSFVFSMKATILTIASFGIIFLIVMIFNGRVINKYTLIELLRANRMNEESNIKKLWTSVFFFIIGLIILVIAYLWALIPQLLILNLFPIIAVGSLATFIIFKSFSGFLLKFMQTNKRHYFKNLNMFVLRQVSAKINSTYRMMAVISLMLLLGIGTLVTGFNLNHVMGSQVANSTPFDASIQVSRTVDISKDFDQFLTLNKYPEIIKSFKVESGSIGLSSEVLEPYFSEKDKLEYHNEIMIMPISHYNAIAEYQKIETINLGNDEALLFTGSLASQPSIQKTFDNLDYSNAKVEIDNHNYKVIQDKNKNVRLENGGYYHVALIINDQDYEALKPKIMRQALAYSFVFKDAEQAPNVISQIVDQVQPRLTEEDSIYSVTSQEILENSQGIEMMFTYIGLYLGTVFLLSSVVILALQQLSEANDNQERYKILSKIGVGTATINRSIMSQIALYFFIPLTVALIHSYIGIKAVNVNLNLAGLAPTSVIPSLITIGFVLLIYFIYFMITYLSSKRIINGD